MSIAVGLHAGRYALLAADRLAWTYTNQALTTIASESRRSKITETGFGLITGSGEVRFVDGVTARVAGLSPQTPGTAPYELLECIEQERRAVEAAAESELRTHALTATGWLVTYNGDGQINVWIYHPFLGNGELRPLKSGGLFAVMRPASYDHYADWLDRTVQMCAPGDDIEASIEHNAAVLRSLIQQYAGEPNAKSTAECTIGVHCDDGRRFLSEVLHPRDVFKCSLSHAGAALRVA